MLLTGGCLCGRIRYASTAPLKCARCCHCPRCRKTFRGAGSAYAEVESGTFSWTQATRIWPGIRRRRVGGCSFAQPAVLHSVGHTSDLEHNGPMGKLLLFRNVQ
jgi:hypothetical protein